MNTDNDLFYYAGLILAAFVASAIKTTAILFTTGKKANMILCWEFPTMIAVNLAAVMILKRKGCFSSIEKRDLIVMTLIFTIIAWMYGTYSGLNILFGTNRYYGC